MNNNLVVIALEKLMKAADKFADENDVSQALEDAKSALGYDPVNTEKLYEVSLVIDFEAISAEEAVKKFMDAVEITSTDWVYKVVCEDEREEYVDTYHWNKQ